MAGAAHDANWTAVFRVHGDLFGRSIRVIELAVMSVVLREVVRVEHNVMERIVTDAHWNTLLSEAQKLINRASTTRALNIQIQDLLQAPSTVVFANLTAIRFYNVSMPACISTVVDVQSVLEPYGGTLQSALQLLDRAAASKQCMNSSQDNIYIAAIAHRQTDAVRAAYERVSV